MPPTKPKSYSLSEIKKITNDKKLNVPKDFSKRIRQCLGEDEDPEFGKVNEKAVKEIQDVLKNHNGLATLLDLPYGSKNIKANLTKIIKTSKTLHTQLNDTRGLTRRFIDSCFNPHFWEISYLIKSQEKKNDSKQSISFLSETMWTSPSLLIIKLCKELIKACQSVEQEAEKSPHIKKSTRATTNKASKVTLDLLSNLFDIYQTMPCDPNSSHDILEMNKKKKDFLTYCISLVSKRFSNTYINKLKFRSNSNTSSK